MKTCFSLPDGYAELQHIDLQKNPKLALLVNALGLLIFALGAFIGHLFVPLHTFYSMSGLRSCSAAWSCIFSYTNSYMGFL